MKLVISEDEGRRRPTTLICGEGAVGEVEVYVQYRELILRIFQLESVGGGRYERNERQYASINLDREQCEALGQFLLTFSKRGSQ